MGLVCNSMLGTYETFVNHSILTNEKKCHFLKLDGNKFCLLNNVWRL